MNNKDSTYKSVSFSFTARHLPFRVGVHFDNNELDSTIAADMTNLIEQQGAPSGFLGFQLEYWQVQC